MSPQRKILEAVRLCNSVLETLDDPAFKLVEQATILLEDFDLHWSDGTDRKILRTWVKCAADWLAEAAEKMEANP